MKDSSSVLCSRRNQFLWLLVHGVNSVCCVSPMLFFSGWNDWHKLFRRPGGLQATLGLLPVSADAAHLAEGLSTAGAAVGLLLGVDGTVPLQVT